MKPHRFRFRLRRRVVLTLVLSGVTLFFWWSLGGAAGRSAAGTFFATRALGASQPVPQAPMLAPPVEPIASAEFNATEDQATSSSQNATGIFGADPLDSLAQSLKHRQTELDAREKELAEKSQRLDTLRSEIEQNLAKSQQVLKQMQQLAGNAAQQRDKELAKWIKIYEGMIPDQAAKVLAQLDPDFSREILSKMDPKKASKILGAFPPEKAVELSRRLKDSNNS